MKNKTKNIIIFLATIAVLLLVVIFYFKIYFGKELKLIEESKRNNFVALENIQAASKIKNKIKEINDVEKSFDDFFIDKKNILGFIENVEKIATTSNVLLVIENVVPDDTHIKDSLPYGVLNMTLTAKGDFNSVNNFLNNLEKVPYYIDFNSVKIAAIGDKGSSDWSTSISLTTLTK